VDCGSHFDPLRPQSYQKAQLPLAIAGFVLRTAVSHFFIYSQNGDAIMDKDRIQGSIKQVVGGIKEAVGKAAGDQKTEADGKAEKAAGKLQNAFGSMKDTVRETFKG